ncbi:MAG: CoB--CoM heterodisulfide reductase iron-sulfur subunit B family protein [Desulfovibrio sp.]|nr:CoB--CoM heterodisulfide reductase iron-sulfur subunit B family protein [Desulfovibrio sp.]
MKFAYYPGCSAHGSSLDYELSTEAVCQALGITLEEIPDWNCCGSTPAHAVSKDLSAALCARNLDIAARLGETLLVTPCPSCLSNMRAAKDRMQDPAFRKRVNDLLDQEASETFPETTSVMQAITSAFSPEDIAKKAKKSLNGLKLVCYYGCLMSRPSDRMRFEDPENPMMMERILEALGATVLDFPLKTACCGAAFGIPHRPLTALNSGKILELATALGADAIVVACPLCQMNLDLRQAQASRAMKTRFHMPIPYYTQLMGLALGIPKESLGLHKLIVSLDPILTKLANAAEPCGERS